MLYVIWEVDGELQRRFKRKFSAYADLWEVLFALNNRTDLNLVAVIMWLIWSRRNSARMGESFTEYHKIRAKAEVFLLDFKSAQGLVQRVLTARTQAIRWMPPIAPFYKINFDGALFSEKGDAGLGVVICDSSGQVASALTEQIPIPK